MGYAFGQKTGSITKCLTFGHYLHNAPQFSRAPAKNKAAGIPIAGYLEYASSGTRVAALIPLDRYRLPLRCQTIMIVNLPMSGSTTSTLIIS